MGNEPTPPSASRAGTSKSSKERVASSTPSKPAEPTSATSTPSSAAKPSVARPALTGTQLATAFNGKLERRRLSIGYHLGLIAIAFMMVLLPIVYVSIIAGTGWLVHYHAVHSVVIFEHVRGRAAIFLGIIYVAPMVAGGLLILAMLLPLLWRSRRREKPFWVSRSEQPLLWAYVESLCDAMRAPRPARIDIVASATASAHIDNGLFGLVRRKLVLTIGLPLPATMSLREFTGVLAHELGHFTQGSSMRVSYGVHMINGTFVRMGFGRSGVDDVIDGMLSAEDNHWSFMLIAGLSKLVVGTAKLILKGLALFSHALTMGQSRAAEFDADYQAARIVGSKAMGDALQQLPATDLAFSGAVERAKAGWARKALPDDLVLYTQSVHQHLSSEIKEKLTAAQLASETSWFDTHPPLYVRVGKLMKAKLAGVMKIDGPATVLFKDFDELSKMATIDLYQGVLGKALQAEHLVPTPAIAAPKPKAAVSTAKAR